MTSIDLAVLNLTEWLCRRLQLLTGRTNVWWAFQITNLSIVIYFVWAAMYVWQADRAAQIIIAAFCGGLLYLLSQTVLKVPVEAHEDQAYNRVAKGFRNPKRVQDAPLRIPFLTLSVLLFYPILLLPPAFRLQALLVSYSLIVLTTIVLYLLGCDPLPPCTGKVREWLRGAAPVRLALSESPVRER